MFYHSDTKITSLAPILQNNNQFNIQRLYSESIHTSLTGRFHFQKDKQLNMKKYGSQCSSEKQFQTINNQDSIN